MDKGNNKKSQYDSLIFTHIPKCGGTSFRKYINKASLKQGIKRSQIYIPGENWRSVDSNINQLNDRQLAKFRKKKYRVIAMHAEFDFHKQFSDHILTPFYYTILRDPIERFISHYYFFCYKLGHNDCKGIHLDDLPTEKLDFLLSKLNNVQVRYISGRKIDEKAKEEELLESAKKNIQFGFACFGLLEDIKNSLKILQKKAPKWISMNIEFPEININDKKNKHLEHISNKLRNRIRTHHQMELRLYDFARNIYDKNVQELNENN